MVERNWVKAVQRIADNVVLSEPPKFKIKIEDFEQSIANAEAITKIANDILDPSKPKTMITEFPRSNITVKPKSQYHFSTDKTVEENHNVLTGSTDLPQNTNDNPIRLNQTILRTYAISCERKNTALLSRIELEAMLKSLNNYSEKKMKENKLGYASPKKRQQRDIVVKNHENNIKFLSDEIGNLLAIYMLQTGSKPEEISEKAYGIKTSERRQTLTEILPKITEKTITEILNSTREQNKTLEDLFNYLADKQNLVKSAEGGLKTINGYGGKFPSSAIQILEQSQQDYNSRLIRIKEKTEDMENKNPQEIFNSFIEYIENEYNTTQKILENHIEAASLCSAFLNTVYISQQKKQATTQQATPKRDVSTQSPKYGLSTVSSIFQQQNTTQKQIFGFGSTPQLQPETVPAQKFSESEQKTIDSVRRYLASLINDIKNDKQQLEKNKGEYQSLMNGDGCRLLAYGLFQTIENNAEGHSSGGRKGGK